MSQTDDDKKDEPTTTAPSNLERSLAELAGLACKLPAPQNPDGTAAVILTTGFAAALVIAALMSRESRPVSLSLKVKFVRRKPKPATKKRSKPSPDAVGAGDDQPQPETP